MRSPIAPRNCRLVSRIAQGACGSGSTRSECTLRPSAFLDIGGRVSWPAPPHHAGGRAEHSGVSSSPPRRAFPHSPCQRTDAGPRSLADGSQCRQASAPVVSRRVGAPRLRLATAGFHGRRRAGCAWSLFFPRSVGFGPTASSASGAFTTAPSMLCHDQAIPSISSYSAKPRRHIFTNTSRRFHSRKYWCTELALPYSLGKAFHWQPVRSTYTMASNTFRGSMRFRPPPGRRLYLRLFSRFGLGISGATRSHRASDTVQDFSVLMQHSITTSL